MGRCQLSELTLFIFYELVRSDDQDISLTDLCAVGSDNGNILSYDDEDAQTVALVYLAYVLADEIRDDGRMRLDDIFEHHHTDHDG